MDQIYLEADQIQTDQDYKKVYGMHCQISMLFV